LEGGAIAAALPLGVEVVTDEETVADEAIFEVLKCLLRLGPDPEACKIGSGSRDCVEEAEPEVEEALEDEDVKGLRTG